MRSLLVYLFSLSISVLASQSIQTIELNDNASIKLPGIPNQKNVKGRLIYTTYTYHDSLSINTVIVFDLPKNEIPYSKTDVQRVYKEHINGVKQKAKQLRSKQKDVIISGMPGAEIEYTLKVKDGYMNYVVARFAVNGTKLYRMSFITTEERKDSLSDLRMQFFNSLQFKKQYGFAKKPDHLFEMGSLIGLVLFCVLIICGIVILILFLIRKN